MPLLRINAKGNCAMPMDDLGRALDCSPPGAPIIVLIHGYKYTPLHVSQCPHRHILSLTPLPTSRAISWPRHLGFGRGDPEEGICISFGWNARGTIWQAHAEAERAGRALAELVAAIRTARRAPVHMVGHSLGARVALTAISHLPEGAVDRAILLAAAETRDGAKRALSTPAGRTAEFVNVVSRENTLFDLLYRAAIHPHRPAARALGSGLGGYEDRWLDLAIDSAATRAHLAGLGFRIPPPAHAACHWSAYLRPGLFPLYRAILRTRLSLAALRTEASAGPLAVAAAPLLPSPGEIAARAWHGALDAWSPKCRPSSRRQPTA